jgi:hypothetical protein
MSESRIRQAEEGWAKKAAPKTAKTNEQWGREVASEQ